MVSSKLPLSAVNDFHRARRRATLQQILARLTGRSADLLSYEDVRRKLRATETAAQSLTDIPLDAIVGSVGRYDDFTRSFLPRRDSGRERWARVMAAVTDPSGVPPVEVYQIGQAYFVRDGNHRVSVARQLGATHIQAYVTPVHAKVDLSPDVQPDDLILKAEYADFLAHTHLDELRPEADLSLTVPGQYRVLEEHIQVHRYFMGLEQQREIPYDEAVAHFYEQVYLPVVQAIRERSILRDFPGRTEADLYLWLAEHRAAVEEELGWEIKPGEAAADLAAQFSPKPQRVVARVGERIRDAITPDELEAGPPPGRWRHERAADHHTDQLFADLLVAVNGEESGWAALDQALLVAQREGARLHGLHVVGAEAARDGKEGEESQAVRAEFNRRCKAAGISAGLVLEVGDVPRRICERARWADLVVLSLSHPPAPQPMARLDSGLSTIIRRCPRPVLAVPNTAAPLARALLAYDGSPKAQEALYVATYISGRWGMPLVVVTVMEDDLPPSETLARARQYLESHGVEAMYLEERGPAAGAIAITADEHDCDLIMMGGYGSSPVLEVALGSTVDEVLRTSRRPMLICR